MKSPHCRIAVHTAAADYTPCNATTVFDDDAAQREHHHLCPRAIVVLREKRFGRILMMRLNGNMVRKKQADLARPNNANVKCFNDD
ncbi:hypothetical protein VNO78_12785 [Psophocarpus tetragonolobus]|uniref:Uncharacterized protein n=1 Tax=Psophocarpus tetragonolobus TaxID=3891 RepID=A0AAN9XPN5_PSOTE